MGSEHWNKLSFISGSQMRCQPKTQRRARILSRSICYHLAINVVKTQI